MINRKFEKQAKAMIKGITPESRVSRFLFVHELLRRYARGEATDREREMIETWRADEEEPLLSEQGEELPSIALDRMGECIYRKVAVSQQFPQTDWNLVSQQPEVMSAVEEAMNDAILPKTTPKAKRQMRAIRVYGGIAAMIAIVFGIGMFQYYTKDTVLESEDQIVSQQLPDHTKVQMNRDSRLLLTSNFNGHVREVEMRGEIFFDVAKNPQKPFIISHSVLQTQVKGTSFTISDYPELDISTITVRTGMVAVSKGGRRLATLLPNKQLLYNKITGKYTVREMDWHSSSGWIDGRIILIDANEKELALRIRQSFHKELVIKNHAFGTNVCFNSEFSPHATLAEVIERLMLVYGAQYKMEGDRIIVYR